MEIHFCVILNYGKVFVHTYNTIQKCLLHLVGGGEVNTSNHDIRDKLWYTEQ